MALLGSNPRLACSAAGQRGWRRNDVGRPLGRRAAQASQRPRPEQDPPHDRHHWLPVRSPGVALSLAKRSKLTVCFKRRPFQIGLQGGVQVHARADVDTCRQARQGLPREHRKDVHVVQDHLCVRFLSCPRSPLALSLTGLVLLGPRRSQRRRLLCAHGRRRPSRRQDHQPARRDQVPRQGSQRAQGPRKVGARVPICQGLRS